MADYSLTISRTASKEFEALPPDVIERVRAKIRALASAPRPPGSKKLKGASTWRIRIGDWRVLYEIDDTKKVVDIAAIRHRSQAYD